MCSIIRISGKEENIMKRLRAIKYVVALVFLMVISSNSWAHTDVTPQEAKNLIDANEQLIVVDVREESEYCGGSEHILGAFNYPWISGVLQAHYTELPLDGEILVVCASGNRSNQAATFLDLKGYLYIYDMTGGMSGWEWETTGCSDSDGDGVNDDLDNCPSDENPNQEDVDCDGIGNGCDGSTDCTEGVDCDNDCDGDYNQDDNCPNDRNPNQEDTYPPQGNGIGDACDCESDFTCDGDVDGEDVTTFLADFGRGQYDRPCESGNTCNGDFTCDGDVDAEDVTKFLEDFGRGQYSNPCPQCGGGDWCVSVSECVDLDTDGYDTCDPSNPNDTDGLPEDCVDSEELINPGATEICDGLDNDCDPASTDGSEDPQVGMPCDGPDSDLCQEGTYGCAGGSLTCSDTTGDDLEVCDDFTDNDCDGNTDCSDSDCIGDPACS